MKWTPNMSISGDFKVMSANSGENISKKFDSTVNRYAVLVDQRACAASGIQTKQNP
jgi:hypothetical protein